VTARVAVVYIRQLHVSAVSTSHIGTCVLPELLACFSTYKTYTPKRRDSENALIFGSADLQSRSTEFLMAKNHVGCQLQDQ